MSPAVRSTYRRQILLPLVTAAVLAVAFAQIAVLAQSRVAATAPQQIRDNAEEVAKRVHRALFNRDNDGSLNDTINEVRAGRLRPRVEALTSTPEFRTIRAGQSPTQLLDQISRGMIGRSPNSMESSRLASNVKDGRITDVVMVFAESPVFRNSLPNTGSVTAPGGGTTTAVDAGRAADCQEQVVEHMRDHTQGIVLLRFETAEADGGAVRGVAVDMTDGNRRLTYRCDGAPSYSYDDGRNTRSAPNEGDFPSERVQSCQNNIRSRVQGQRPGVEVTFESAALTSSGDQVRGLGFEKKPQGQNFHYRCQLNGTTVTSASHNWR